MSRKLFLLTLALLTAIVGYAQNVSDLVIAEVLAEPDSTGVVDDYGRRGGWIEIYNTSMGTVKFGGCYLTDDPSELRKSLIPKSDLATQLGPRQSRIIFASGRTHDGSFYTDFTLAPGKTVYLVSNDGRTVIDSLEIPADLPAGKSVAKIANDPKGLCFHIVWPCDPTPGAFNGDPSAASKSDQMAERDPHGRILTLVSVGVVFSALAILWILFLLLFDRPAKRKDCTDKPCNDANDRPCNDAKANPCNDAKGSTHRHSTAPSNRHSTAPSVESELAAAIALALDMEGSGEIYAAIATALHLHLAGNAHDAESFVLTIRRDPSLWNANKTEGFRRKP